MLNDKHAFFVIQENCLYLKELIDLFKHLYISYTIQTEINKIALRKSSDVRLGFAIMPTSYSSLDSPCTKARLTVVLPQPTSPDGMAAPFCALVAYNTISLVPLRAV